MEIKFGVSNKFPTTIYEIRNILMNDVRVIDVVFSSDDKTNKTGIIYINEVDINNYVKRYRHNYILNEDLLLHIDYTLNDVRYLTTINLSY